MQTLGPHLPSPLFSLHLGHTFLHMTLLFQMLNIYIKETNQLFWLQQPTEKGGPLGVIFRFSNFYFPLATSLCSAIYFHWWY